MPAVGIPLAARMRYYCSIMQRIFLAAALLSLPAPVFAATLQEYMVAILMFINNTLIPSLFALAFLFFIINVVRYFIIGGASDDGRKSAKRLALWGIIAFVLMVSIWGIVNMLVYGFGFGRTLYVCPDYMGDHCAEPSRAPIIEDIGDYLQKNPI